MKILHIITEGDVVGGAGIFVQTVSRRLLEDGHAVAVATGKPGTFSDLLAADEIPWREVPSLTREIAPLPDFRALAETRRLIREERPDLVVCHSSKAGVVGRIAARLESVPSVFTVHGWDFTDGVPQPWRTLYLGIERLLEPITDRFVCVSDFDRNLAVKRGFRASKLLAIHNGIPDTGVVTRRAGSAGRLDVAMVARFSDAKDQATVVRAVARVPGVRAHFVGDGPTKAIVENLASDLGVADRCVFYGYQPDVATVLGACDVFCLMSIYEGFPLTTLEAMRAGMPVIVSRAGGSSEAVLEGVTGHVVARRDDEAVAALLEEFRDDPDQVARMGKASRERYLRLYAVEQMYASTLTVYRTAAAEGQRHLPRRRIPELVHLPISIGRAGGSWGGDHREQV